MNINEVVPGVNTALNEEMPVIKGNKKDMDGIETVIDDTLIQDLGADWSNLNILKTDIATKVMELSQEIASIALNPALVAALGSNHAVFDKTVRIFFDDVQKYSKDIETLRLQHEHRTGPVTSIEDYDVYNRIAFNYHSLSSDFISIVAPTATQIVMLISEIRSQEPVQTAVEEPASQQE